MTECTFLGILPQEVGLRSNQGVGRSDIKLLADVRAARHQQRHESPSRGVDELMPTIFPQKMPVHAKRVQWRISMSFCYEARETTSVIGALHLAVSAKFLGKM